jgi:hypothetical protein
MCYLLRGQIMNVLMRKYFCVLQIKILMQKEMFGDFNVLAMYSG